MTAPDSSFRDPQERADYESKVTANIAGILGRHAGLRRAWILKGQGFRTDQDFEDLLETAEITGALTAAEIDDLLLLNVIAAATSRSTLERVYVAVGISISASDADVNQAASRAATLRKLPDTPVTAVLVTANVGEPQALLAATLEVTLALHHG